MNSELEFADSHCHLNYEGLRERQAEDEMLAEFGISLPGGTASAAPPAAPPAQEAV